jgi:hypothetical protein
VPAPSSGVDPRRSRSHRKRILSAHLLIRFTPSCTVPVSKFVMESLLLSTEQMPRRFAPEVSSHLKQHKFNQKDI